MDSTHVKYKNQEEKFLESTDKLIEAVKDKFDSLTTKEEYFTDSVATVTLKNNTVHVYKGTGGIRKLTLIYPNEDFISTVLFSTASSGTIEVVFPNNRNAKFITRFVGSAEYEFFPAEDWELNIHNGRVIGSLVT